VRRALGWERMSGIFRLAIGEETLTGRTVRVRLRYPRARSRVIGRGVERHLVDVT
jgi:hypothetical protein